MRMHSASRAILLAICASLGLVAQTGQIAGLITDPSSTAVPGAAVTITNVDTGIQHEVVTNEQGQYPALFRNPGDYKIPAQKQALKLTW